MKRVIITGGTGFIGANLVRRLLKDGHQVYLLVRKNYSPWRIESVLSGIHLREVDFLDKETLIHAVGDIEPQWVFHLAVHGAYSWQKDTDQMVGTNIAATINLVEACLKTGFEAFVNTGSSSEYGFKQHAVSENDYIEPNSCYAVTKAFATLFCRYIAQSRNVPVYTLRLYSAFGPYEDLGRLMPTLIAHGLRKELPPLADPDIARDYVYIDDVVEAYVLAATRPGQESGAVYNVGTSVQTSLKTVIEIACRVMDITVEPKWGTMPNRAWDTRIWLADNRKIKEQLGWQPKYTFEQGFRAMVDWFHKNLSGELRGQPSKLEKR